ncbi:aminotransferase class I/II-fold pyridoxal phosphate-dependent enzyme [Salmonella enterica]|nr:aminotransferase class I/II-fold pyridoxal phosphate-dependent enzyme [Salmonella enterica]ELR7625947.1 aminotransferase class I/II-fold pyridoxal phosphate-dependent enzyme [Salmonella enterica]
MNAKIVKMKENTPVLAGLKRLCHRKMYSFHALPISSHGQSDIVGDTREFLSECLEGSATGELFDNFFFPHGIIAESQKLTAKLYNADASFYITSGTSTSNQIAITALFEKGQRILIDKNCHQSIHFHAQAIGAEVRYLCPDLQTMDQEISAWSYAHLENTLLSLQNEGKGCDIVILTAQSYEGIIYDIPQVLSHLLSAGVQARKFFIDEAWGSLNYFSEDTRQLTAMNIDSLLELYPDLEVICTHSAHKSLFCLRQASIIHCRGKKDLAEKIETAKYRIHTTSPSYPILASLDAAQAMMSVKGEILATHTRELVHEFIMGVSDIAGLGEKSICREVFNTHWHIQYDPTKIMIDVSALGTGQEIKTLLSEHDIYLKRFINNFILLNFYIGINREAIRCLLSSLTKISKDNKNNKEENAVANKFIISYPPGVPLVFPGDVISKDVRNKINECKRNGCLIIAA